MKVLRVISSMNPENGGPCQGLRSSIPELIIQGVGCDVVCLDKPDEPYLANNSFPVIALGPSKTSWCYSEKLLPWLIENLCNYDVVIIHGLWLYHGFAVHKAIKTLKKNKSKFPKYYVMPHGMLDPYFQNASGRKLKAIRNKFYWRIIESHIINDANGVLFTCKAELMLAKKTFIPYFPENELNIGYGISSPPLFSPEMKNALQVICPAIVNKPFILFLSRIHEKKGVDILIKGYIELFNSNKNLPLLLIAGPGLETSYGQSLIQMVNEKDGLRNNVLFTGMLSGDSKWGAFYSCEAFILPSHQENFGIAVVEALACAKPVLISNQVNIFNEIIASQAGIVADDSFEGVFSMLNSWLLMTDIEKEKMRESALKSYKDNFTIQSATKKLINSIVSN